MGVSFSRLPSWPEPSSRAQFIRARVFSPLQQVVFGALIRRIPAPWLLELIKREPLLGSSLFGRKSSEPGFSTKERAPKKGLAFDKFQKGRGLEWARSGGFEEALSAMGFSESGS